MLHLETVEPNTFSLLEQLMEIDELKDFALVGGTALSLYYGHRISVDLDLFSTQKFDPTILSKKLAIIFKDKYEEENISQRFGLFCYIDSVKVDIVNHPHLFIDNLTIIDNIRMASPKEIVAMKGQAILGRGKKKDFWDIAELLNYFSVKDFNEFHKQKFPNQNLLITVPQAMTYFDEADEGEDPVSLKGQTWEGIKKIISKKVNDYLK